MTTISWLMLFRKLSLFFSENRTKNINTLCGQNAELLIVKVGGTYSYHWFLKGVAQKNILCPPRTGALRRKEKWEKFQSIKWHNSRRICPYDIVEKDRHNMAPSST
jgi:hypothetical protein